MESREIVITKLNDFFRETASQYNIEMVFLYGSWSSGYPKEESDIDIGVLFGSISPGARIHSLITSIVYALTLEIKSDVNIVNINPDFDHPMLYYNIIALGIPLYIKDNDRFLNLKLEALSQMEDFQLFGVKWQYDVARKIMREVF
jgi:predicted nucleotidyltransferase